MEKTELERLMKQYVLKKTLFSGRFLDDRQELANLRTKIKKIKNEMMINSQVSSNNIEI